MRKDIAGPEGESTRPMWESLEGAVREKAQEFIQQILEEEVTELLGREKSERKAAVDAAPGYRNGYGKARRLAMSSGTITVRRPRVRGLEERFESRVLPLFARRTKEIGELLPELYLHGLAEGDFELALRGLLGEGAPLSKASIRRLRAVWSSEFETWAKRSLADREVVYVWADGIYVKAGLERDKAALRCSLLIGCRPAQVRPGEPRGLFLGQHGPAFLDPAVVLRVVGEGILQGVQQPLVDRIDVLRLVHQGAGEYAREVFDPRTLEPHEFTCIGGRAHRGGQHVSHPHKPRNALRHVGVEIDVDSPVAVYVGYTAPPVYDLGAVTLVVAQQHGDGARIKGCVKERRRTFPLRVHQRLPG